MSTQPPSLHHNLIDLPAGKTAGDTVAERHDIVLLFDATKANPNGDRQAKNGRRQNPPRDAQKSVMALDLVCHGRVYCSDKQRVANKRISTATSDGMAKKLDRSQ